MRRIGPFEVQPIGMGCMSLSHGYGDQPPAAVGAALLHSALDLGYDLLDTAALYGYGQNETLIGAVLRQRRSEFILASKCGMRVVDGRRRIDGSPAAVREVLDQSLLRLRVETIDLYYLHRPDPAVPIEESVGALADAVAAGKIRAIGLSEVAAPLLRRAHRIHPIAALQSEYSLWTRNPEIAVLDACAELGIAFVAFAPLGRGFLTDADVGPDTLSDGDLRKPMPRFSGDHWSGNRRFLPALRALAADIGITTAQLALAWVQQSRPHVIGLPGTRSMAHLAENFAARQITLPDDAIRAAETIVNRQTVHGERYQAALRGLAQTEEFE